MLKMSIKLERSDPATPFFFEVTNNLTTSYRSYFKKEYVDKNKILKLTTTVSDDRLTCISEMHWFSKECFLEMMCDELCYDYNSEKHKYNVENNIKSKILFFEECEE